MNLIPCCDFLKTTSGEVMYNVEVLYSKYILYWGSQIWKAVSLFFIFLEPAVTKTSTFVGTINERYTKVRACIKCRNIICNEE